MWMAKDQALTNIQSNSSTPATTALDFGSDCFTTQDSLTSVPSGDLRCPSLTNMTYNMGSPSTSGSIQGLSTALSSCTNRSSSLCIHTSPVISLNIGEVTNTFESPTFIDVKNEKNKQLTCEINTMVVKSKSGVKLTAKKQTTGKFSREKFESSSSANSSEPDTSKVKLSNDKQPYSHRYRQPRSLANRKSQRDPVS
ncbi:unnamed protein product [Schistosoma turkestanicum]|nr:unnamed protein product [Schistosoma turkestanicum]